MFPSNPESIFDLHHKKEVAIYLDFLFEKAISGFDAQSKKIDQETLNELRSPQYAPYSYALLTILYYLLHDGLINDYWPEHENELKKLLRETPDKKGLQFPHAGNYLYYLLIKFKTYLEKINLELAQNLISYFNAIIQLHPPGLVERIEIKSDDLELHDLFTGKILSFDEAMIENITAKFQSDCERSAVRQVKEFFEKHPNDELVNQLMPFIKATTAKTEYDMGGFLQRIVSQHLLNYFGKNNMLDTRAINLLQPARQITIFPFREEVLIIETLEYSKLQCAGQQILPIKTTDDAGREIQQQESGQPFLRAILGYSLHVEEQENLAFCQIKQLYTESSHPVFRKVFILDNVTEPDIDEDTSDPKKKGKKVKGKNATLPVTEDIPIFRQILLLRSLISQFEENDFTYQDYLKPFLGLSEISKCIFLQQAERIISDNNKLTLLKNYFSRRNVFPDFSQWFSTTNLELEQMLKKLKNKLLLNASKTFANNPFNAILCIKDMWPSTIKSQLEQAIEILRGALPPIVKESDKKYLQKKKSEIEKLLVDIKKHFPEIDSLLINPNNETHANIAIIRKDEIKVVNQICFDRDLNNETCEEIYSDQLLIAQSIGLLLILQKTYYQLQLLAYDINMALTALNQQNDFRFNNHQQLTQLEQGLLLSQINKILTSDLALFRPPKKKTTANGDRRARRTSSTARALPPQPDEDAQLVMIRSSTSSRISSNVNPSEKPRHRQSTP